MQILESHPWHNKQFAYLIRLGHFGANLFGNHSGSCCRRRAYCGILSCRQLSPAAGYTSPPQNNKCANKEAERIERANVCSDHFLSELYMFEYFLYSPTHLTSLRSMFWTIKGGSGTPWSKALKWQSEQIMALQRNAVPLNLLKSRII